MYKQITVDKHACVSISTCMYVLMYVVMYVHILLHDQLQHNNNISMYVCTHHIDETIMKIYL